MSAAPDHFVFVIDKPNAYCYINGKLEVGKTGTNAWKTTGTEPVTIGNNEKTPGGNSRKRSFDGLLDEAASCPCRRTRTGPSSTSSPGSPARSCSRTGSDLDRTLG